MNRKYRLSSAVALLGLCFAAPATAQSDLSITTPVAFPQILPGIGVRYDFRVHNNGQAVSGAVVTNTFSSFCTPAVWSCYVDGAPDACTPVSGTGNLDTLLDLRAGATAAFRVECRVDPAIPADANVSMQMQATTPAGNVDPNPGDNTASIASPGRIVGPYLTSSMTVAGNFFPGGAAVYTAVLTNISGTTWGPGPSDIYSNVMSPLLTQRSATATHGTATINALGDTNWVGTLEPGQSVTITTSTRIAPDAAGTIYNQSIVLGQNASLSDDPTVPGVFDSTNFVVGGAPSSPLPIPATTTLALLMLALGLAFAARRRARDPRLRTR